MNLTESFQSTYPDADDTVMGYTQRLLGNVLMPNQVDVVIKFYKDNSGAELDIKWDDKLSTYPETFPAILKMAIYQEAVTWLETNHPQHWGLGFFRSELGKGEA